MSFQIRNTTIDDSVDKFRYLLSTENVSPTGPQGFTGSTGPQGFTGPTGPSMLTTGSWTLSTGAKNVSFTTDINSTYVMWVRGNIPNGIIMWNATISLSNGNVPAIGNQYGWYYLLGSQLVLTSIPSQITGINGSIINTGPATTNANVFNFGITNNTESSQTVYYGYFKVNSL